MASFAPLQEHVLDLGLEVSSWALPWHLLVREFESNSIFLKLTFLIYKIENKTPEKIKIMIKCESTSKSVK